MQAYEKLRPSTLRDLQLSSMRMQAAVMRCMLGGGSVMEMENLVQEFEDGCAVSTSESRRKHWQRLQQLEQEARVAEMSDTQAAPGSIAAIAQARGRHDEEAAVAKLLALSADVPAAITFQQVQQAAPAPRLLPTAFQQQQQQPGPWQQQEPGPWQRQEQQAGPRQHHQLQVARWVPPDLQRDTTRQASRLTASLEVLSTAVGAMAPAQRGALPASCCNRRQLCYLQSPHSSRRWLQYTRSCNWGSQPWFQHSRGPSRSIAGQRQAVLLPGPTACSLTSATC